LSAGEVGQMYQSTKDGYLGKIIIKTGLVGYWKLDDNNALTSVIDYTNKGNTGTAYSSTATSTSVLSTSTAMIGRAMSFDGGNDWVGVDTVLTSLNYTTKGTISLWAKVNQLKNYNTFIGFSGGLANHQLRIIVDSSGLLIAITYDNAQVWTFSSNSQVIFANTWYHIVLVQDGVSPVIYVNGILVPITFSYSVDKTHWFHNAFTSAKIGQMGVTAGTYMDGLIDEVKIWNYARSAEQIGQDYIRGLKGLP